MAASKSVLGCLKTGALADCLIAPFFFTAPLPKKSSTPRVLPFIFFISARITSRAACPADVRGLRWPRFSLRFDLRAAGFMEDNFFCRETLPQMLIHAVRRSFHGSRRTMSDWGVFPLARPLAIARDLAGSSCSHLAMQSTH